MNKERLRAELTHTREVNADLYEALKAMADRWEPDCIGTDRVMWENARAALAKARGDHSHDRPAP